VNKIIFSCCLFFVSVLFSSSQAVLACQVNSYGSNGDYVTVTAQVTCIGGCSPNTDIGSNSASVSWPYGDCYISVEAKTQYGYIQTAITYNTVTFGFKQGQVGNYDLTEILQNYCDSSNIPAVTSFISGSCAEHPAVIANNATKASTNANKQVSSNNIRTDFAAAYLALAFSGLGLLAGINVIVGNNSVIFLHPKKAIGKRYLGKDNTHLYGEMSFLTHSIKKLIQKGR